MFQNLRTWLDMQKLEEYQLDSTTLALHLLCKLFLVTPDNSSVHHGFSSLWLANLLKLIHPVHKEYACTWKVNSKENFKILCTISHNAFHPPELKSTWVRVWKKRMKNRNGKTFKRKWVLLQYNEEFSRIQIKIYW